MKKILNWDKPKKKMSTEEWKKISADGAWPGVYTPNMSEKDMVSWKANYINGKIPRVEIRKTFVKSNNKKYPNIKHIYCQCLITISNENIDDMKNCNIVISANGKIGISNREWTELNLAIKEAKEYLNEKRI